MSSLLQLHVKRRQTTDGFYDDLKGEYENFKVDPEGIGTKLTNRVERWLVDEENLTPQVEGSETVKLQQILTAISNRVCEIAGHAWLEFIEDTDDDTIRGTTSFPDCDSINAQLAEFIPEISLDALPAAFGSNGGPIRWRDVTDRHLLDLFRPLMEGSTETSASHPSSDRISGSLPGEMNLVLRDELQDYGDWWFKDRAGAVITPVWRTESVDISESVNRTVAGSRYSFYPEQDGDFDNCLTWVSRALDDILPLDWLESIRIHCDTTRCMAVPSNPCDDLHIRSEGRMKCIVGYASQADAKRRDGFGVFHG